MIPQKIQSFNPDELDIDPKAKVVIKQLLGIIEQMSQTIQRFQKENQRLKDEIHRLKGEKGRPHFKPNVPSKEHDRYMPKSKKKDVTIKH